MFNGYYYYQITSVLYECWKNFLSKIYFRCFSPFYFFLQFYNVYLHICMNVCMKPCVCNDDTRIKKMVFERIKNMVFFRVRDAILLQFSKRKAISSLLNFLSCQTLCIFEPEKNTIIFSLFQICIPTTFERAHLYDIFYIIVLTCCMQYI